MAIDYRQLANDRIDEHESSMRSYEAFSNNIFIELTKLLITIGSGMLTLSLFPISNYRLIDDRLKVVLLFSWLFIFLSIIFGVIQLAVEHRYYSKVSKFYADIRMLYISCKNRLDYEKAVELQDCEVAKNFKGNSTLIPFSIQIFLFLFATTLLFIILCSILLGS